MDRVKYKKAGDYFTTSGGAGIREHYIEIEESEYSKWLKRGRANLTASVEANLSDAEQFGYGFYGCYLNQRNGKCYLVKKLGTSCD